MQLSIVETKKKIEDVLTKIYDMQTPCNDMQEYLRLSEIVDDLELLLD